MTVRWQDGNTVQNYSVRATSASGVNSTCETTENSCSFLELSCGQLYTFTVTGYNNVCVSDMGDPIERHTGTVTALFNDSFYFSYHNDSNFYYYDNSIIIVVIIFIIILTVVFSFGVNILL